MTTKEVKQIPLADLLGNIGFLPEHSQKDGNELWYKSPLREEKTPSFKITIDKNTWYDFGAAAGGSIIDFAITYFNCDVTEAFERITKRKFVSVAPKLKAIPVLKKSDAVELRSIKELNNPALVGYLVERGINISIARKYVKEIYYRRNGKNLFTVGMENDSNGYEVRTKFFKGCILSKDLTSIINGFDSVSIFEGFIDFISLLTFKNIDRLKSDIIILHSTSQVNKAVSKILNSNYKKVFAFTDNDDAGDLAFSKLCELKNIKVKDMRYLYEDYKDFNDKLLERK